MPKYSRAERLGNLKRRGGCCLLITLPILFNAGIYFSFGPVAGFITLIVLVNLSLFIVAGKAGFTLIEIAIWVCGPTCICGYILYPVLLQVQAVHCLSNMRQLAQSTLLYAQDYDDVLPYDAASFRTLLSPYVKDRKTFTCPFDRPGVNSYTFNDNLANVSTDTIKALNQTVLIYEGKVEKLNYRHQNRASVVFVDGSGKLTGSNQVAALLWTTPTPNRK